jgi:AbrB family looped-hinge helix DNA binding protein
MKKKENEDMPQLMEHPTKSLEGRVKVSSKGQIVIPADVRKAANINSKGQELKYTFEDGRLVIEIEEYLTSDELFGILSDPKDNGDFTFDLQEAREERAEAILKKGI